MLSLDAPEMLLKKNNEQSICRVNYVSQLGPICQWENAENHYSILFSDYTANPKMRDNAIHCCIISIHAPLPLGISVKLNL
ncbi:hypothetical protein HNY73_016933 [Argiope bruennichi]|uniref:Uncharacterized protein n=1 Tax=Argiope bruennichi TaxID=94029 RepID=A0A8T0EQA9_ARGBR|nr:hypothetical protein HNY73_016933 [Argiope bruennichi]